jgi:hypothetical protein
LSFSTAAIDLPAKPASSERASSPDIAAQRERQEPASR